MASKSRKAEPVVHQRFFATLDRCLVHLLGLYTAVLAALPALYTAVLAALPGLDSGVLAALPPLYTRVLATLPAGMKEWLEAKQRLTDEAFHNLGQASNAKEFCAVLILSVNTITGFQLILRWFGLELRAKEDKSAQTVEAAETSKRKRAVLDTSDLEDKELQAEKKKWRPDSAYIAVHEFIRKMFGIADLNQNIQIVEDCSDDEATQGMTAGQWSTKPRLDFTLLHPGLKSEEKSQVSEIPGDGSSLGLKLAQRSADDSMSGATTSKSSNEKAEQGEADSSLYEDSPCRYPVQNKIQLFLAAIEAAGGSSSSADLRSTSQRPSVRIGENDDPQLQNDATFAETQKREFDNRGDQGGREATGSGKADAIIGARQGDLLARVEKTVASKDAVSEPVEAAVPKSVAVRKTAEATTTVTPASDKEAITSATDKEAGIFAADREAVTSAGNKVALITIEDRDVVAAPEEAVTWETLGGAVVGLLTEVEPAAFRRGHKDASEAASVREEQPGKGADSFGPIREPTVFGVLSAQQGSAYIGDKLDVGAVHVVNAQPANDVAVEVPGSNAQPSSDAAVGVDSNAQPPNAVAAVARPTAYPQIEDDVGEGSESIEEQDAFGEDLHVLNREAGGHGRGRGRGSSGKKRRGKARGLL